jgi:hypothetical protein
MFLGEKIDRIINGIFLKAQSTKPEKNTDLYETRRISKFPDLWAAVFNSAFSAGLPIRHQKILVPDSGRLRRDLPKQNWAQLQLRDSGGFSPRFL